MTKSALLELCVAHSASTTTPSVTLNTPANSGTSSSLTPQLQWTGIAGNSQLIPYEVQLDTVNTFNSIPATPSVVGSRGSVLTVAAGSITPLFGQATTAGNLLIAWVTSNDSAGSIVTASPGWSALAHSATAFLCTSIFGKFNCAASEAAPTFTSSAGNSMIAQAGEYYVGPGAVLDQTGNHSIAQTGNAQCGAVDTQAGELVIALEFWGGSNAGPTTIGCTLTDSNGSTITSPNIVDNHTTTGTTFYAFADAVTVRTGVAGGDKIAASLGVFANGSACICSIIPGATPLVDALSAAGTGFADITHPGDTSPYPSGDQIGYTLQSALTNSTVYYWRVRQLPTTANVNYTSAWSSTFSFTASSSSTVNAAATIAPNASLSAGATQGFAAASTLAASASLSAGTTQTFPDTATITPAASLAAGLTQTRIITATISPVAAVIAGATQTFQAACTITATANVLGTAVVGSFATLTATASVIAGATTVRVSAATIAPSANVTAGLTLDGFAATSLQAVANLVAGATLIETAQALITATAVLIAAATTASAAGPTPPSRILYVTAETRTFTVTADVRTLTVPTETRTLTVPAETRKVTVTTDPRSLIVTS